MKIPTPTPQEDTRCPDSAWFANQWLRGSPRRAIRTAPVIAVVQELLNILRDEQASTQRAHTSLRRAVRLLGVIAAEAGTQPTRQTTDRYDSDIHVPTLEQIAGSASSRRFAAEWLRGSPHATIRTSQ